MKKFSKRLTAGIMSVILATGVAVSSYAATVCPPHQFKLKNTTSSVVGANTHIYVESVTNNVPKYGTCVIQKVKVVKLYQCICGQTKTETHTYSNHTSCGI